MDHMLGKSIELFRLGRRILNPNLFWKMVYSIRPGYFKKKRNQSIEMIKDLLHKNNQYFDEGLYLLIELLKKEARTNEMIYYYNYSLSYYKRNAEYHKLITIYKIIIRILEDNPNIYVLEADSNTLLIRYNRDISEILAQNFELDEAIYYLERARKISRLANNSLGIDSISVQIGILLILTKRYDRAIACFETIISDKPHYNFQQKDMNIIMLYILTMLANNYSTYTTRNCFEELKKKYMNLYECREYIFLINVISSVENNDLDHLTHEVHNMELTKEPVFKQLFVDIHRLIVLKSRKIASIHY